MYRIPTVDSTCIFTFFLLLPSDIWIYVLRLLYQKKDIVIRMKKKSEGGLNLRKLKIMQVTPPAPDTIIPRSPQGSGPPISTVRLMI